MRNEKTKSAPHNQQKSLKSFFDSIIEKSKKIGKEALRECFFALITAAAVFLASVLYHNWVEITQQNDLLNRIYISVSDEYVESLFGIPYISVKDENNLCNNYYVLKDAVLRTVSHDDSVVAYFITSTSNKKIKVESHSSEVITLGRNTYTDIDFPNPIISALSSTFPPINHYCEIQGTGRYGMYNHYVFSTLPYGYSKNEDDKYLIMSANTTVNLSSNTDIINNQELNELRAKVAPNTFGVIADGFEDKISVIPNSDWWKDVYYMLSRTS